eukprot:1522792-Alexandrium_andersonii.AAC.1
MDRDGAQKSQSQSQLKFRWLPKVGRAGQSVCHVGNIMSVVINPWLCLFKMLVSQLALAIGLVDMD